MNSEEINPRTAPSVAAMTDVIVAAGRCCLPWAQIPPQEKLLES
jgi:hypothetical protein